MTSRTLNSKMVEADSIRYVVVMIDGDGSWYYDAYTPWNGSRAGAAHLPRGEAEATARDAKRDYPTAWSVQLREVEP